MEVPGSVTQWRILAEQYSGLRKNLLPEEILAIIWTESTGNPHAENKNDPSFGLMQIEMPIARMYGGVTNRQSLFSPGLNISIGSAFLSHLKEVYSDHYPNDAWIAGYNEGEGNLTKGYKDQAYVDTYSSHKADILAQVYPEKVTQSATDSDLGTQ